MRRLNCHNLVKKLNSLCNSIDQKYDINYGGCCYLSYLIAKHLEALNLEYDLIIFDSFSKNKTSIINEVTNCKRNRKFHHSVTGEFCSNHYCIRLKGAGIINGCEYGKKDGFYVIPNISYKNIRWIYRGGDWNTRYETSNNKTVKKLVREFFKEYESFRKIKLLSSM